MSTTGIIVTVVVVVVIALLVVAAWTMLRRRRLQHRFGPEYDRTVAEQPNRSAAEQELRAREERHAQLDVKPLSEDDQRHYSQEWSRVQAAFVEDPSDAVNAADALVAQVMKDRGYPTGEFNQRVETLSVEHARTLDHYRQAHQIFSANLRGEASTEQLRQAVVHYRALASDLLDVDDVTPRPAATDNRNNGREIR
jgi:FtsZ-interacting cell division protein ZipA